MDTSTRVITAANIVVYDCAQLEEQYSAEQFLQRMLSSAVVTYLGH